MSRTTSVRRPLAVLTAIAVAGVAIAAGTTSANAAPTGAAPAVTPTGATSALEARNTATVRRALTEFYGQGRTERVGQFFAGDYIEHDPTVGAGRAGLVAAVKARQALNPRPVATIKHLLAEGSLVAVHSHVSPTPADEFSGQAAIELFRLADNRIVEHWRFAQAVPATSASGNTMFSDLYRYDGPAPTLSRAAEEANKQLTLKIWPAVFMARDLTAIDRYWAPGDTYLQHNPRIPNGTAGLRGFLASMPPTVSQNRFAIADGDLVLTINQSIPTTADLSSDYLGSAVADIYRIAGGRAVEHWDVVQPVPATSANGNSLFSSLYQER